VSMSPTGLVLLFGIGTSAQSSREVDMPLNLPLAQGRHASGYSVARKRF
jgi:hypothetical protein